MPSISGLVFLDEAGADVSSSDFDLDFLSEPFYPSPEPYLDFSHLISSSSSSDPSPPPPSSPPSQQLGSLSIEPADCKSEDLDHQSVKLEASSVLGKGQNSERADSSGSVLPDGENKLGFMQRSFSSRCLDQRPCLLFHPGFSSLTEVQAWDPVGDHGAPLMRRSCSTGDFQARNITQVGRYSAEERRQRIHKYRCKRNQRNFNKKIKYACRKTLADSRPRVRGRFAKNDEMGEIPKASVIALEEGDEDYWYNSNMYEEEAEESKLIRTRGCVGNFTNSQ